MIKALISQQLACLAALSALGLVACGGSNEPEDSGSVKIPETGMDADLAPAPMNDAGVADALMACTEPGCACSDDSLPVNCYPPPIVTPTGTNLCALGSMYCRDGTWSSCESLIQFGLESQPSKSTSSVSKSNGNGLSGITSALLSDASVCNACHPNCYTVTDRPVPTDLTAANSAQSDAGTSLITYDPVQAGIRLTILSDTAQRGATATTAICGNSVVEGVEQCDDGNLRAGDGCDGSCLLEAGYYCPTAGFACARSVCGNARKEGLEQCDDGNLQIGDGCTPQCALEPTCASGMACTPVCGDGKVFPTEPCDDGNVKAGDGCSPTCTLEPGWNCVNATGTPPDYIDLPIVYRDFVGVGVGPAAGPTALGLVAPSKVHQDFQNQNNGLKAGIVKSSWETDTTKATYKKPVAYSPLVTAQLNSAAGFDQWYTDVPNVNVTFADTLRVTRDTTIVTPTYVFASTAFFPLDGKAGTWPALLMENLSSAHNFSFTSEVRFWFVYNSSTSPASQLDFYGDDDVWVFINGTLAVDIGGVHGQQPGSIKLDSAAASKFSLTSGKLYEAAVFQAERHTTGSNYKLTLAGFFSGKTSCTSICGDGIVTPNEYCDDGTANGTAVGACLADCTGRAPTYAPTATYWRDYSATGSCHIPPERPLWGSLTWATVATSGGSITFRLQGAETAAGVTTATPVNVPIVVTAGSGSFDIFTALTAAGVQADPPYLRVTAVLSASSDQKLTPVLKSYDVALTCVNVE